MHLASFNRRRHPAVGHVFFFWRRRISPSSVPRSLATAAAPQTDGIPANQARYAPAGEITTCGERARAAHMRT